MKLSVSEKINLGTKEIAKQIREKLKKEYPKCNFGVTIQRYSGGSSIHISLKSAPFAAFKTLAEFQESDDYNDKDLDVQRKIEILMYANERQYDQVNHFHIDSDYSLTDEAKKVLQRVVDISNEYNYDHSDIQTDYFDTNFYLHLNIGECDKPFIKTEEKDCECKLEKTVVYDYRHKSDNGNLF